MVVNNMFTYWIVAFVVVWCLSFVAYGMNDTTSKSALRATVYSAGIIGGTVILLVVRHLIGLLYA